MRNFFFLAVASLFLAGDNFVSASLEEASLIENEAAASPEFNLVDRDVQSRRKDWDIFSTLLMMLGDPGACLENHIHGPIECHEYKQCMNGHYNDCDKLCEKSSHHDKSHYSQFCNMATSAPTTTNVAAATSAEVYGGNQTPGGFIGDGAYSIGTQFWLVAAALSVGMALVAVHMGQRREAILRDDRSLIGAEVRGSVGRRVGVVSGLMDGVLTKGQPKQVEMLEIERADTYESAMV